MSRIKIFVLISLFLTGLVLVSAGSFLEADENPTIFIKDLKGGEGVPEAQAKRISNVFSTAMTALKKYEVRSHDVVENLLVEKDMKEALDCNDEKCMKQILEVTQTEYLAFGEIMKVEREYEISVKLLYRKKGTGVAEIAASSYQPLKDLKLSTINEWVKIAVRDLTGQASETGMTTSSTMITGPQAYQPQTLKGLTKMDPFTVTGTQVRGRFNDSARTTYWYRMSPQQASNKMFVIRHQPGADFDFKVYDDEMQVAYAGATSPEDRASTGIIRGTAFLQVWNYQGMGDFTIDIMPGGHVVSSSINDEIEPNDTKQQANRINSKMNIHANMSSPRDVDWFQLGGQEGVNPTFTITHNPNVDFDFEVYNNDERVGSATSTRTPDSVSCRVPSTCYLKVWSARGSGDYDIQISRTGQRPMVQSGQMGMSTADDREPNDNKYQASRVSSRVINGMISHQGDQDWYQLTGQEGTNPTFTISHDPGVDFDFEVYNNDQRVAQALGTASTDSASAYVPGTCYLRVWSARGTGAYTITMR